MTLVMVMMMMVMTTHTDELSARVVSELIFEGQRMRTTARFTAARIRVPVLIFHAHHLFSGALARTGLLIEALELTAFLGTRDNITLALAVTPGVTNKTIPAWLEVVFALALTRLIIPRLQAVVALTVEALDVLLGAAVVITFITLARAGLAVPMLAGRTIASEITLNSAGVVVPVVAITNINDASVYIADTLAFVTVPMFVLSADTLVTNRDVSPLMLPGVPFALRVMALVVVSHVETLARTMNATLTSVMATLESLLCFLSLHATLRLPTSEVTSHINQTITITFAETLNFIIESL